MTAIASHGLSSGSGGRGPQGLLAAFLVALLLHGAGLVGLLFLRLTPPTPPGEQMIEIDLAPQMTEAETQAPNETQRSEEIPEESLPVDEPTTTAEVSDVPVPPPPPPEETLTAERPEETPPPPPPEAVEALPEEVQPPAPPETAVTEVPPEVAPPPEEQVITSQAPEAEALAPPPPVAAKPREEKKPDPAKLAAEREAKRRAELAKRREIEREKERREAVTRKREEQRDEQRKAFAKAKADREAQRRAQQAVAGRSQQNSASSSRQNAGGSAALGSDPNAMASWKASIASAIRNRMNREAASGTPGGVATVRFTVSRSGSVSGASLAGSSGVSAIDGAALTAVRGSLPPAPPGVTQANLSVTVPLRFSPGR